MHVTACRALCQKRRPPVSAMADKLKIRPLHDRVILQRLDAETKSPGGIVIPDSAAEADPRQDRRRRQRGKILENGTVRPLDVKVGDQIVLFGKYSGTEVKVDGEDYLVMREEDVWRCSRSNRPSPTTNIRRIPENTAMAAKDVRFSDDARADAPASTSWNRMRSR